MDFLHKIEAILILDTEGERVFAKYYPVLEAGGGSNAISGASPTSSLGASSGRVATQTGDRIEVPTSVWGTYEKQRSLEKNINSKVRDPKRVGTSEIDIMLLDGHTVVFQAEQDLAFVVVGPADENEMVLCTVLQCLTESLQQVLKASTVEKRLVLEKYEALLLIIDEMIDDGVILETSSSCIVADVQPFEVESSTDGARKALHTINKYLKQNL